jgi:uncharacterized membrane protein (DUF4010 family)
MNKKVVYIRNKKELSFPIALSFCLKINVKNNKSIKSRLKRTSLSMENPLIFLIIMVILETILHYLSEYLN